MRFSIFLIILSLYSSNVIGQLKMQDDQDKVQYIQYNRSNLEEPESDKLNNQVNEYVLVLNEQKQSFDEQYTINNYKRTSDTDGSLDKKVMTANELLHFIPDAFENYHFYGKPEKTMSQEGGQSFSAVTKYFFEWELPLTVTLSDYLQTKNYFLVYNNWSDYNNEYGVLKSVKIKGQPGWYSVNYTTKETKLILTVHDRFLLKMEGFGLQEYVFDRFIERLDFSQLPE